MSRPLWFPDWSGERCIIIGSGPSAGETALDCAAGIVRAIAVNNSWRLAPWADVLYACDADWWRVNDGVTGFPGLRVGQPSEETLRRGIVTVTVKQKHRAAEDDIILDPGTIGGGGGSGFQALNLAVQFGCRDIALVGLDATLANGTHWHGDHGGGLKNPLDETAAIWRAAMDRAGPSLRAMGVSVVNCSRMSAITAFPKVEFQDWLLCSS